MNNNVNLVSFNCNGLGFVKKRQIVSQNLKKLNAIIFIKETHCTKEEERKRKKEWEFDIYFSNWTSKSSGVAILFPKNINFEICNKKSDSDGRLLILQTKIDENLYVLCNVYIPTQDHKHDQINFLIDVKNYLSTYQNENILLGGDFNLHLNPKLDKIDSMSNKNDNIVYRKEMLSLLDSMNLSDCFRNVYPNL